MNEKELISNPLDSLHLIIGFSRIIGRNPKAELTPELAKEIEKHSYQVIRLLEQHKIVHWL